MSNLTNAESYTWQIIQENYEKIPQLSISELAELAHVSLSTVNRTVRKKGFEGYGEFRYSIREKKLPEINGFSKEVLGAIAKNQEELLKTIENISAEEIEKLLLTVKENYDLQSLREFTFEAGRIDTLDREKLEILKKHGVDKISINPQSFNEKTLKLVNRYHNREEFDNVYNIAKEIGLKINMDLILGLPGETTEDILHTLEEVEKYNPENLTIHNLAIKNASRLNKENYRHYIELDYEKIFNSLSRQYRRRIRTHAS